MYEPLTLRNSDGRIISGIRELQKDEFGTGLFYKNGEACINWNLLSEFADTDGFDTRIVLPGETSYKKLIILTPKTIIIRYGPERGSYTAPKGTAYENLSLPYTKDTVEYHEYMVLQNTVVECLVEEGIVAPGFSSAGGGIQYLHDAPIYQLIRNKTLERLV